MQTSSEEEQNSAALAAQAANTRSENTETAENVDDACARPCAECAQPCGQDCLSASAAQTATQQTAQENAKQEKKAREQYLAQKTVEYVKRTAVLIVGLFIMSFGVGLSIRADLGTSPVSSIPYVLNIITGLSVGTTTIIVNVLIVLLQIVLLRKRFRPLQLLQIPVCIAFGLLCDLALACMPGVIPQNYWQQWLICAAGIVLVGLGVSLEVTANVTTLAGEGLSLALCQLFPKVKFGYMKVIVDCSFVVIAVALSFIFLHRLAAVREGTVAAALLVGIIAKTLNRFIVPLGKKFFLPRRKQPPVANQTEENPTEKNQSEASQS